MSKKNILWINYIRAICILAVYLVHSELYYGYSIGIIDYLVHPFYVNAFFFVSGYLMFRKQLSEPVVNQDVLEYTHNEGRRMFCNILFRILIPSIVFSIIEFVPAVIINGGSLSLSYFLHKTLGGGTYWFTSALVVAQLIFLMLFFCRRKSIWTYIFIGLAFSIAGMFIFKDDANNPWQYKQGIISMFFLSLGGLYWRYEEILKRLLNRYIISTLVIAYIYLVGWHYEIIGCVISTLHINILGVILSALICVLLPSLLKLLPSLKTLEYIGKNSICFYFMSGATPIVIGILIGRFWGVSILGYITVLTLSIITAYLGTYVINKWLPWLLDFRILKRSNK